MIHVPKRRFDMLSAWIVPVALLGSWFWLYSLKGQSNSVVANPLGVFGMLLQNWSAFVQNAWLSICRLFGGAVLGTILGAASGLASRHCQCPPFQPPLGLARRGTCRKGGGGMTERGSWLLHSSR